MKKNLHLIYLFSDAYTHRRSRSLTSEDFREGTWARKEKHTGNFFKKYSLSNKQLRAGLGGTGHLMHRQKKPL